MMKEGNNLVQRLAALADGTTIVEIKKQLFTYTLRVICQAAFGLTLTGEYSNYFLGPQFPDDVMNIFTFMMATVTFPFPSWMFILIPYYRGVQKRCVESDERFGGLCKKIIAEKRQNLADDPNNYNQFSVIDILINKEHVPVDVQEGHEITDVEIIANVKTFFLAGSETTSVVLTWALFFLTQSPDILAEMRTEVDKLLEQYDAENISADEFSSLISKEQMPLMHAILKETTRMYTPGSMIFLQLESDTENYTLSNGIVITPDVEVICAVDHIHWNEQVFPEAKCFKPKRWMTSDVQQLSLMESNYMAFGQGPRICPGMNLALSEALIGLSCLVYHFDFQLACPASEIKRVFTFAAMANKMPMKITPRKR